MKKRKSLSIVAMILAVVLGFSEPLFACTGISFKSKDGSKLIGRTMEWGGYYMESHLVLVPRGYSQLALTPTGLNGMSLTAKYGYFGIGVLEHNFIAEGMNEKGLAGELFYFPGYGRYEEYNPDWNSSTMVDAQVLSWILGNFASIEEMEKELDKIHIVPYGHGFGAVHYNIADASGRHVVMEFLDGKIKLFENLVGVITNAPSFDWHMTNLNNYMNVFAGGVKPREIVPGLTLSSIGVGSASMGLPGDLTPPSRFVRAAFFVHTAIPQETAQETALQIFQILNNFDVPVGTEFADKLEAPDMLSATQWTTALDLTNLKFYYRTEWNYTIRCVDLKEINFARAKYKVAEMDKVREHPIEMVKM